MKKTIQFFLILVILIFNRIVFSQTSYDIEAKNFSFSPAQLTINTGDTVRWTNKQGTHNVVSDDNLFTSGDPSSTNWVYEFVFDSPGTYRYYCVLHGGPNGSGMAGIITVETATGVNDKNISLYKFELAQNYPNPFNPSTKISYQLAETGFVSLKIYDILGNKVANLVEGKKSSGNYVTVFDGSKLSSGIYFYILKSGKFIETKKMILMK